METRNSPFSTNNEEDRISNLPDALIHHILSFLHIKYAVQLSVLSRRWRYIWTSLPTLNFDDILFRPPRQLENSESSDTDNDVPIDFVDKVNDPIDFGDKEYDPIDFVDKVLMLRASSIIQSCRFYWTNDNDQVEFDTTSHVNTWILAAVRRNVQELSLKILLWVYQSFQFPRCFFTCKSLTKLVLNLGCYMYSEIVLPNSMDFPMLKSLELKGLSIYDDEKSIDRLISSCPVLESLIMSRCCLSINNITALKLKHFKLKYSNDESDEKKTIKLYAPNLTSFICKSYMSNIDYALENLTSLVTSDILMMVEEDEESEGDEIYSELSAEVKKLYAINMMNFLRALNTTKYLRLSPLFLEVLSEAPNLLESQPLQFCNLRCLELRTFLSRDCFRGITYLFKISPNMESLYLKITECSDEPPMYPFVDEIELNSSNMGDDWEAGLPSPCMLYHLKFVKIIDVKGCLNELKFLEILLKNAIVLKQVVFYCKWKDPDRNMIRRMEKFTEKLIAFPRASSNVAFMCF